MSRLLTLLIGAAAGAAAAHFLDPQSGSRRRQQVKGAVARTAPTPTPKLDDVSLARKVETEIFRAPDAPKGDVSVDVQAGVVHLRGTADDAWIARLGEEADKVDGVKGVKNLLHRPGTPAPTSS
jgi:osmotically-inducible protein OsmY